MSILFDFPNALTEGESKMKAIVTIICLLFAASSAIAKELPEYHLVLLDWGEGRAISDNGRWIVTSWAHDSKIWNDLKQVARLPNTDIFDINNAGTINGADNIYWGDYPNFYATTSNNRNRNNPYGWDTVFPKDIYITSLNNNNLMTGRSTRDYTYQVILQPNTEPIKIENNKHNYLFSINDFGGQLWVYSHDDQSFDLTYLITKKGGRISLGSNFYPVDMSNTSNYVTGVNIKDGQITRWDPKSGTVKLETPPYYVYLNKVNKHGSVVASSDRGGLIWLDPDQDPSFINLNLLLSDPNRYMIRDAVDISDDGEILVTVYVKIDDPKKPYWRAAAALLVPKETRKR